MGKSMFNTIQLKEFSAMNFRGNIFSIFYFSTLLAACGGGDVSKDLAQDPPYDVSLEQCELAEIGVVGTPIDPVIIDGVEIQACVLDTDLPDNVLDIRLKTSHQYQPLVWVLDGIYEIGESKRYATLAELEGEPVVRLWRGNLYARENTLIIIHRNGAVDSNITIRSIDDDQVGGGEWGGVVVNAWGYHPDCPADTSADKLCNIEGPWGYYGGLSKGESENYLLESTRSPMGFQGAVAEAGGTVSGKPQPEAAVVINAPLQSQINFPSGVFYSGTHGLELNGGNGRVSSVAMENTGHAMVWKNGFSGSIADSIIFHSSADYAALKGELGDADSTVVDLTNITLVDKDLTAGMAIELSGSHQVSNVVVQGFNACLQADASATDTQISNSVFFCGQSGAPAADGINYAAQIIASATNYYEDDPDLTPMLALGDPSIVLTNGFPGGASGNVRVVAGYEFGLYYDACFGVGTLLDETVQFGSATYQVCELDGVITNNFTFDDDINDVLIAWALKGNVTFGESFSGLSQEQQLAQLSSPQKLVINGQSKIVAREGASLVVNPGVTLRVRGSRNSPATISSIDTGLDGAGEWGGITINGIADTCNTSALCELAQQSLVDVSYLRIMEAGANSPALTLNQVNAASQINHLDITGSAAGGLAITGGAVNIKNLVMADVVGDQINWSQGYTGTLQYAVLQASDNSKGHALRGQNNAANHDASPRSRPVLANITMVGGDESQSAILLEQGSGLLLYNSVVTGFPSCLDIDDPATAALQSSAPQGIHFGNVVLDCAATLASDAEDAGEDYGFYTQQSSGVYEVPAVLDSQFIAAGGDVPAGIIIDAGLLGQAASYLDLTGGYMGAVRDSNDTWFAGWSDSIFVELAAECDYKGVLEDTADFSLTYTQNSAELGGNITLHHKVCSLRGTVTEDFHLTNYTGTDREAIEAGTRKVGAYIRGGETFTTEENLLTPLPTVWLLNGMVHIGEGHLELTDLAQVQAMKDDPVVLTIDPATIVMSTANGGLHITRGGLLDLQGGPHYAALRDLNETGPVNFIGRRDGSLFSQHSLDVIRSTAVAPITAGQDWVGLIVDGFGRNNQCPDADTAEPGSQICNIKGEYGYHGGYDNSHANLSVKHLNMGGGRLEFNSVGQGGSIEFMKFFKGSSSQQHQKVRFDGGAVNIGHLYLENASPLSGSVMSWSHGFQGTLQHIYISGSLGDEFTPGSFDEAGNLYPIILGLNSEAGSEDALPRSKPTLVNLSMDHVDLSPLYGLEPGETYAISLAQGSGLYLYNSIIGMTSAWIEGGWAMGSSPKYCIKADATSSALAGVDIVLGQLANSCSYLTDNTSFDFAIADDSTSVVITFADFAFSRTQLTTSNYYEIEALEALSGWEKILFPRESIVALGEEPLDYTSSTSVNEGFVEATDYLGSQDYLLLQEHGGVISD